MRLTTVEIATLAAAIEDDGARLCRRLNITSPDEVDRSAGISTLYARGLMVEGDDGMEIDGEVGAAVSVAAAADRVIRLTTSTSNSFGSTQLHWADGGAVAISPLGFGTFEFRFVDPSAGLVAVVERAAEVAEVEGAFIVTDIDTDKSAAIRDFEGERSLLRPGADAFETSSEPMNWDDMLEQLSTA